MRFAILCLLLAVLVFVTYKAVDFRPQPPVVVEDTSPQALEARARELDKERLKMEHCAAVYSSPEMEREWCPQQPLTAP